MVLAWNLAIVDLEATDVNNFQSSKFHDLNHNYTIWTSVFKIAYVCLLSIESDGPKKSHFEILSNSESEANK